MCSNNEASHLYPWHEFETLFLVAYATRLYKSLCRPVSLYPTSRPPSFVKIFIFFLFFTYLQVNDNYWSNKTGSNLLRNQNYHLATLYPYMFLTPFSNLWKSYSIQFLTDFQSVCSVLHRIVIKKKWVVPIFQFLPNSAVSDTQRRKLDISTTIFGIYCTFTDKRGKDRKNCIAQAPEFTNLRKKPQTDLKSVKIWML